MITFSNCSKYFDSVVGLYRYILLFINYYYNYVSNKLISMFLQKFNYLLLGTLEICLVRSQVDRWFPFKRFFVTSYLLTAKWTDSVFVPKMIFLNFFFHDL